MTHLKRAAAFLLLACLTVCLLLPPKGLQATSATQRRIDETEQERQQLEAEQQQSQQSLDGLRGERNVLRKQLNNLNDEIEEISERLEDLTIRIQDQTAEIEKTQLALEQAIRTEELQYENMVTRIRRMYMAGEVQALNAILGAGSFRELLSYADFYEKLEQYDREKLAEYKENREVITAYKAQLEVEMQELEALKAEAEAENERVSELIREAQSAISNYGSLISEEEAEIRQREEAIKKKEEDLEYLKKKLEEERALAQRAQNASWRNISDVTFEEGDRTLLATIIYCEAGGEPYEGKVAVGAVVINRLLSSVYPDTVSGVIYQKGQFSPVSSGRFALALARGSATESCYRAADEAMAGTTTVGNCLYFRTPIEGLSGISIGGHIFY